MHVNGAPQDEAGLAAGFERDVSVRELHPVEARLMQALARRAGWQQEHIQAQQAEPCL